MASASSSDHRLCIALCPSAAHSVCDGLARQDRRSKAMRLRSPLPKPPCPWGRIATPFRESADHPRDGGHREGTMGLRAGIFATAALAAVALAAPAVAEQAIIDEWPSIKTPPAPALKEVTVDPKTTALLMLDFVKQTCNAQRRPR